MSMSTERLERRGWWGWGAFAGGLGVSLALLASPWAGAQSARGEEAKSAYTLTTEFLDAIKSQSWPTARDRYQDLRGRFPHVIEGDLRLKSLMANAYYELKEYEQASEMAQEILKVRKDHLEALYLKAKAQAKLGQMTESQTLLLSAAQEGKFVLRTLQGQDAEVFGSLSSDPGFMLQIMKRSQGYKLPQALDFRNPFISPLAEQLVGPGDDDGGTAGTNPDDQIRLQMESEIDQLINQIIELAEQRQIDELIQRFGELRRTLAEYEGLGSTEQVRRKLEEYNLRLREQEEVLLSIKLQVYITDGNRLLREMATSIREDNFDQALDLFTQLEDVIKEMRSEERQVFKRNANALELQGTNLASRARRLKRISEFELIITGIVVAENDINSAIIKTIPSRFPPNQVEAMTKNRLDCVGMIAAI